MKGGRWSPPRHKLECMRKIALATDLDPTHRDLLVEVVETYMELDDEETIEFDRIWRKETTMELPEITYSARLEMKARNEGRAEGREMGREEGRTEGSRRILLRLLELRFGPVEPETRARVEEVGSVEELERLAERVLTASSLADMGLG